MILHVRGVRKTTNNHLVAKRRRDCQHISQMPSNSVQIWIQNSSKIGPKMVSERVLNLLLFLGCFFGPKLDPKMVPKRLQNWSQNGVSCPDVLLELQVGPKMDPKWLRSPKMDAKWLPNGASTASPAWPRRGTVCRCFLDFADMSKTSAFPVFACDRLRLKLARGVHQNTIKNQ